MAKAARKGDLGSEHDGFPASKAIEGSPDIEIDGRLAVRVGDAFESHPHVRHLKEGSSEPDPDDAHYRFRIGMLVRHPRCDLEPLLGPLGITPANNRVAGDARVTPNGRALPGTYRESFWNWSRLVEGERHFMIQVARLADQLEPHEALLRGVVASGGRVAITLALPGAMNIGSELSFREMTRLAALEIDLDIEVFPHIGNFDRRTT